ncbi:DNA gyrase inhibitor YacG [Bosea sp. (in: a-proteobacteria)]|uniref:DNA gyrase inhibitor YacG n=1 Tax=Bosea sp. (in: a-proteobacteria) TaxID=1871050 RepID=UPI001AD0985C|nr:DNA gyrase inhibitor YacG [Bosea sp. (in: a-proteobacteria)]MBN9437144.1 DNA gyrase inhibitor YacG [Bosea sp. (in: a-proteobacteria)]MBN9445925.1 DNA gyrase inhibitor YacG [Bosea sp. (in: a-proteobacteria)]
MVPEEPSKPASPGGRPCPICGKPAVQRFKPFCSARCADIDLGRWLKGSYVIPGEPVEDLAEQSRPRDAEE